MLDADQSPITGTKKSLVCCFFALFFVLGLTNNSSAQFVSTRADTQENSSALSAEDDALKEKLLKNFEKRLKKSNSQLLKQMERSLEKAMKQRAASNTSMERAEKRIASLESEAQQLRSQLLLLQAQLANQSGSNIALPAHDPSAIVTLRPPTKPATAGRPFMGVGFADLDSEEAKAFGVERGIRLQMIVPNAPAAKAGMRAGDVLSEMDGRAVDREAFGVLMEDKKVGDRVRVTYLRMVEGSAVPFKAALKLAARSSFVDDQGQLLSASAQNSAIAMAKPTADASPLINMRHANLGKKPVRLGIRVSEEEGSALKIVRVDEGSNAAAAGIKVGDTLIGLDGKEVSSVEDVIKLLADFNPGQVADISYKSSDGKKVLKRMVWVGEGGTPRVLGAEGKSPILKIKPDVVTPTIPKKRGFLGIGLEENDGSMIIDEVVAGSTAAHMGLQVGDKLLEVNGKDAESLEALGQMFQKLYVGDRVQLTIERKGARHQMQGRLGKATGGTPQPESAAEPEPMPAAQAGVESTAPEAVVTVATEKSEASGRPMIGFTVVEDVDRLEITEVESGSAADIAGLLAGDTLVKLGAVELKVIEDIRAALSGSKGEVLCEIRRGQTILRLPLALPE